MEIDLRQPNISGSDHEMLLGLKSYLFQLREQLQWAFDNLEAGSGGSGGAGGTGTVINVNQTGTTSSGPSFTEIKNYIIKQADIALEYINYQEVQTELKKVYVAQSQFDTYQNGVAEYNTYIEQNILDVQTSTDGIRLDFDRQKAVIATNTKGVENLQNVIETAEKIVTVGTKGFIDIGVLRTETVGASEVDVIGIAIGQKATDRVQKYAEFVSDGISFYDANDTQVAHMGDKVLTSPNVRVNTKMSLGDLVDTVEGDYIITRWEG